MDIKKPEISIIIPIKDTRYINNVKKYLEKQSFKNFETIILDSKEPVSVKRNKGVKMARGMWIVFIDDDVILHPKWLEELLKNAKNDKIVMGSIMNSWKFGGQRHAQTCNCIFKKNNFKPFNESFKYAAYEDKDWFYRMGGVDVIPSAVLFHIDQQRNSIKKNFIFGMESVKFDMIWKKESDHSSSRAFILTLRDSLIYLVHAIGILYGMIKYGIFRRR